MYVLYVCMYVCMYVVTRALGGGSGMLLFSQVRQRFDHGFEFRCHYSVLLCQTCDTPSTMESHAAHGTLDFVPHGRPESRGNITQNYR